MLGNRMCNIYCPLRMPQSGMRKYVTLPILSERALSYHIILHCPRCEVLDCVMIVLHSSLTLAARRSWKNCVWFQRQLDQLPSARLENLPRAGTMVPHAEKPTKIRLQSTTYFFRRVSCFQNCQQRRCRYNKYVSWPPTGVCPLLTQGVQE